MDIKKRINQIAKEELSLRNEKNRILAEQKQKPLLDKLNEFQVMKESMNQELKSHFPSFILPIMLRSESINSIAFTAYAPYFNDGEACEYAVNTSYLIVNGSWEGEDSLAEEDKPLLKEITSILDKIPVGTYRDIFGDNIMVTVNRDGTLSVSNYVDHD